MPKRVKLFFIFSWATIICGLLYIITGAELFRYIGIVAAITTFPFIPYSYRKVFKQTAPQVAPLKEIE